MCAVYDSLVQYVYTALYMNENIYDCSWFCMGIDKHCPVGFIIYYILKSLEYNQRHCSLHMHFGLQAVSLYQDDVDKNLPLKTKNQALGDACITFDVLTQPSPLSGFRLLPPSPHFWAPCPLRQSWHNHR